MGIPAIMAIMGILLIFNPNADPMTQEQKVMQGAYLAVHAIDWGQTRYVASNPDEFYETNIILGSHPSVGEVNRYMGSTMLLHAGITKSLPSKYRKYWQVFTLGVEIGVVGRNMRFGVKVDF